MSDIKMPSSKKQKKKKAKGYSLKDPAPILRVEEF